MNMDVLFLLFSNVEPVLHPIFIIKEIGGINLCFSLLFAIKPLISTALLVSLKIISRLFQFLSEILNKHHFFFS
jgi:hypothetical protein